MKIPDEIILVKQRDYSEMIFENKQNKLIFLNVELDWNDKSLKIPPQE